MKKLLLSLLFTLCFILSSKAQTEGWQEMKSLNDDIAGRDQSQMVSYNNKLYFFGGYGGNGGLTDFWEYNPATKTFVELESLPITVQIPYDGAAVVVADKMYFVRAFQLYEYNFITKTWTSKAALPSGAANPGQTPRLLTAVGSKLYVPSGATSAFYSYDIETDTWSTKANYPGSLTSDGFIFTIGTKIYKGGGQTSTPTYPVNLYEYDTATDVWTAKANAPGMMIDGTAVTAGGKGYVGGGKQLISGTYVTNGAWYEYSPTGNTWAVKASGHALSNSVGSAVGTDVFLFAGFSTVDYDSKKNSISRYSTTGNTWTVDTALAGGNRMYGFGYTTGDKIYAGGGIDQEAKNDFWEYYIPLNSWIRKRNFPSAATQHVGHVSIGSKLYTVGGFNGITQTQTNSVYEYDAATDLWTAKAVFPGGANRGMGVATLNGVVYAGGGRNNSIGNSNKFYKFTPGTNVWALMAQCPTSGYVQSAFAIGNMVYFVFNGGIMYGYNIDTNIWTAKATMTPNGPDGTSNSFVSNGNGYVINQGAGASLVRRYNPSTDTWVAAFEAPFNKIGQILVKSGEDVFVGMGLDGHIENDWYKLNFTEDVSVATGDLTSVCNGNGLVAGQSKTMTDTNGKLYLSIQAGANSNGSETSACFKQRSLAVGSPYREQIIGFDGSVAPLHTAMFLNKNFFLTSTGGFPAGSTLRMFYTNTELAAFVSAFNTKYGTTKTINDIKIVSYGGIPSDGGGDLDPVNNRLNNYYTLYNPSVVDYKSVNKSLNVTFATTSGGSSEYYAVLTLPAQTLTFPTIASKVYGAIDFASSVTSNNNTIPITYTSSNTAVATVAADGKISIKGAGSTTIIASQAGNSNFSAATPVSRTLTVTPAPLLVNAEIKTKLYGAANPALTVTYSGFVNGDDATKLTTQPIVSTTALLASPVNTYPITVSGAVSTNYTFNYTASTLTITRAPLTISARNLTKVYDGVSFTGGNGVNFTGLVAGDTETSSVTGTLSYSGSSQTARNTGKYVITPSGLSAVNYTITFANGELSIDPKPITATASAVGKVYKQADPALTYTLTGTLITGDVISGSLIRVAGENAGTYAIAQGTLTAGSNYSITFVGANLTVTPKSLTITADAKNKVYRSVDPTLSYVLGGTLESGDSFTGSLSRVQGENVGTYAINSNLTAGNNYAITFVGASFTITAKPLTITAVSRAKAYGSADPALTYTLTGTLESGDAFTGVLSRVAGENSDNYAITQGTLTAGGNYAITYVPANLTINKVGLTISADNKTRVQGVVNPTLTASFSGFVNNETSSVLTAQPLLATTANLTSAVGTYFITASGATALNYDVNYVAGTLTVSPAPPVITSFTPTTSVSGATINITGNYFTGATSVSFGGTAAASFIVNSPTSITAVVGTGASGNISVATSIGTNTLAGYTFVPKPTISASGQTTFASGGSVILTASSGSGYTYKWFRDGVEITTATSSIYTATTSGAYTVTITANGVSSTSNATSVNVIFTLPANNFKITYNGETCKTSNNGKISIEAVQSRSYTALLTGNGLNLTKPFTTTVDFADLQAGNYNVCITVAGEASFKQCFDVVVTEPKDLSVYATVDKDNKVSVALGGSDLYFVELNGNIIKTNKESLELALKPGENILKVSTAKDCQGVFEKRFMVYDKPILYPNPFVSEVNLFNLQSSSTTVEVMSLDGKVIFKKNYESETKAISVELDQLNTGAYILKATSNNSISIFKIIKK